MTETRQARHTAPLPVVSELLLSRYARWHNAQCVSGDIDPVYPVLQHLQYELHWSPDDLVWACLMHGAWYDFGTTLLAMEWLHRYPRRAVAQAARHGWPTGVERRGHRGGSVALWTHLRGLQANVPALIHQGEAYQWAHRLTEGETGVEGWGRVIDAALSIPGNGRWAAYKQAELLQKVVGLPIAAPDAGHRYSTGPRKGMARLFQGVPMGQTKAEIELLDRLTYWLAAFLGEPDIAAVETSLCDWNSLARGNYYLGHDIDQMLGQYRHAQKLGLPERYDGPVFTVRQKVFPAIHLGEAMRPGSAYWHGIRKELKTAYRDTGSLNLTGVWP